MQIRHSQRLMLVVLLAVSACGTNEPASNTSSAASTRASTTTGTTPASTSPTPSLAFGGQVFCEQVRKDHELFTPGFKVLDVSARSGDNKILTTAASLYRQALTAMKLAWHVCTGGRYTDPNTIRNICAEAKKYNAPFVVGAMDLTSEAGERLQDSQLQDELSSALDGLVDAASKYGIIVGSAHNCYPTS